jgi:hypothetical protein
MIGADLGRFLEEGLAIHVGTRDTRLRPNGARAAAATVAGGGRQLIVYIPDVAARRLLPDLESNGHAAVVFCRPTDDRACQVKGVFAGSRAATPGERALVRAQWNGFLVQLERIGIPRAVSARWVTWPATAVTLAVTELFDQTPGPQAGTPLA